MAEPFPNSRFYGFDTHGASLHEARRLAASAGVAERVSFQVGRSTEIADRRYGLICYFDTLHDLGDGAGEGKGERAKAVLLRLNHPELMPWLASQPRRRRPRTREALVAEEPGRSATLPLMGL